MYFVKGESKIEERKGRHLLSLLGYLHGYKLGQDYALQLQPYFISPVIIIPTVNQQQSVTVQDAINDENYQESGSTIQTITSAKLISNMTDSKESKNIEEKELENGKNCDEKSTSTTNTKDSLRQASSESTTSAANSTEIQSTTTAVAYTAQGNETKETTTQSNRPYISAIYNNTKIESLELTTSAPKEDPVLPPVSDNRWQNFTLRANLSIILDENTTMINEQQNNTVMPLAMENATVNPAPTTITYYDGRYPNSLYNNAMINQLSITTNSYTNEESPLLPAQNDGWSRFTSYNEAPYQKHEGFKPLAGLYYDGFLHRPLKKFGFIPDNYVY